MKCEYLHCTNEIEMKVGKVKRRFCSDKCRKASKRAESKGTEATASPTTDKLRTDGTKLPSDSTPDITPDKPKRGKDIKCFADLPPDLQATIDRLSESEQEHKRRTAIAINYQQQFPDRYECVGIGCVPESNPVPVRVSKPGDADYKPLCETTRKWARDVRHT